MMMVSKVLQEVSSLCVSSLEGRMVTKAIQEDATDRHSTNCHVLFMCEEGSVKVPRTKPSLK